MTRECRGIPLAGAVGEVTLDVRGGPGSPDAWQGINRGAARVGLSVVEEDMLHALIIGSSGYVGSRLVAHLAAAGHDVTATARNLDKLARFDFPDSVRPVRMDVTSAQSCRSALDQVPHVDVAYYLVHSIGGDDFAERDLDSANTFAAAATGAGVARIVYLGGFVPAGEELSEHLESRADVGEALNSTAVDLVWLRAAVILGAGSTSYELIRYLAERLPIIPLPKFMTHPVAPIAVDDVLGYLTAAADPDVVPPGHYDISNGESLTYSDLIRQYAEHQHLRRWWVPLPFISAGLAAPLVSMLTPIPRDMVADLVQSLRNTMDSHDHAIRDLVPDPPAGLTVLSTAIDRASTSEGFKARGVSESPDPLQLTTTDPRWAGGDAYRKANNTN